MPEIQNRYSNTEYLFNGYIGSEEDTYVKLSIYDVLRYDSSTNDASTQLIYEGNYVSNIFGIGDSSIYNGPLLQDLGPFLKSKSNLSAKNYFLAAMNTTVAGTMTRPLVGSVSSEHFGAYRGRLQHQTGTKAQYNGREYGGAYFLANRNINNITEIQEYLDIAYKNNFVNAYNLGYISPHSEDASIYEEGCVTYLHTFNDNFPVHNRAKVTSSTAVSTGPTLGTIWGFKHALPSIGFFNKFPSKKVYEGFPLFISLYTPLSYNSEFAITDEWPEIYYPEVRLYNDSNQIIRTYPINVEMRNPFGIDSSSNVRIRPSSGMLELVVWPTADNRNSWLLNTAYDYIKLDTKIKKFSITFTVKYHYMVTPTTPFYHQRFYTTPIFDLVENKNICNDTYILYYLNDQGAIENLPCTLNNTEYINVDKSKILEQVYFEPYNDGNHVLSPISMGDTTYLNKTRRSYTLNTAVMRDEEAKCMRDLIKSPYVFMVSNEDTDFAREYTNITPSDFVDTIKHTDVRAINITDTTLKIKKFKTDKVYNYTINAEDAEKSYIYS